MEYYVVCNSCGKGFVYNDEDVNKKKADAGLNLLSAVGQMASAFSGNQVGYIANKMNETELRDFNKCPHCGSTDLSLVTKEEFQKSQKATPNSAPSNVNINTNASIPALIKRTVLFLEEGEWDKAEIYANQILDADPENAQVYLILVLIENKASSISELLKKGVDIRESKYYRFITRYADDNFKQTIFQINRKSDENKHKAEERRALLRENKYQQAIHEASSDNLDVLNECLNQLNVIGLDYKDAALYVEKCKERINHIKKQKNKRKLKKIFTIVFISVLFITVAIIASIAFNKAKPLIAYQKAITLRDSKQYDEAITAFSRLDDYKDSKEQVQITMEEADSMYYAAYSSLMSKQFGQAIKQFNDLGSYRDSEELSEYAKELWYDEAIKMYYSNDSELREEARHIFSELGDYKDSENFHN